MIRWIFLFIFFALLFACDTASNIQPPNKNYFIKYFGGDGDQIARDVIVNSDGTFYILGNSRISTDSIQKVYLAHANAQGEVMKQITYGSVEMDARDFVLTSDGNLAVVANAGVISSNLDIHLIRFSLPDLKPIDNTVLSTGSTNSYKYANSITELTNHDFIVEGYFYDITNTQHPHEELHMKIYNQGSLLIAGPEWNQTNGAGAYNVGVKTFQKNSIPSSTDSISFYTFATTDAAYDGKDNYKFFGYFLPSSGGTGGGGTSDINTFEKAGAGRENTLTDVVKVAVGGYLLVGISGSADYKLKASVTNSTDASIVFSPAGVLQDSLLQDLGSDNARAPGTAPSPFATAYSSVNNYNFILANIYNSQSITDILLMKVNNDLSTSWEGNNVQFGGDGDDMAAAVSELPDGHIMVLGTMQLGNPPAQFKIALIKLNSDGKLAD